MSTDEFWRIINSAHERSGGLMDIKCDLLKEQLIDLSGDELMQFIDHFDQANESAYTWALWGAAYIMNGGCSDDAFSDFRASLISQGRETFEAALANPDSLADLEYENPDDICYEGFNYVMLDLAEEIFEKIVVPDNPLPDEPPDEEWEVDDLYKLYPRLWSKYEIAGGGDANGEPPKPWWRFW